MFMMLWLKGVSPSDFRYETFELPKSMKFFRDRLLALPAVASCNCAANRKCTCGDVRGQLFPPDEEWHDTFSNAIRYIRQDDEGVDQVLTPNKAVKPPGTSGRSSVPEHMVSFVLQQQLLDSIAEVRRSHRGGVLPVTVAKACGFKGYFSLVLIQ